MSGGWNEGCGPGGEEPRSQTSIVVSAAANSEQPVVFAVSWLFAASYYKHFLDLFTVETSHFLTKGRY